MSAKCLDRQGRWRNKTVAFRVSPEEDELLETAVRLSGLTKQDYRRLKRAVGEERSEYLILNEKSREMAEKNRRKENKRSHDRDGR